MFLFLFNARTVLGANVTEEKTNDADTKESKCPVKIIVKDDVSFEMYDNIITEDGFDFSSVEDYFNNISDSDMKDYINSIISKIKPTFENNKYCPVYCVEKNTYEFPGYAPVANSGGNFTWTIGKNNDNNIINGLTVKLSGIKSCTTKVDLDQWIADYKKALKDVEEEVKTIVTSVIYKGGIGAQCDEESGLKLSDRTPNPKVINIGASDINRFKEKGVSIDGNLLYDADTIVADYSAFQPNQNDGTAMNTKYVYYFSTKQNITGSYANKFGVITSQMVQDFSDDDIPGFGASDAWNLNEYFATDWSPRVEDGDEVRKLYQYEYEKICCHWEKDFTTTTNDMNEPISQNDGVTGKYEKISCSTKTIKSYKCEATNKTYDKINTCNRNCGNTPCKISSKKEDSAPCEWQHYTRKCTKGGSELSTSEIPEYVKYLGKTSVSSTTCPSGYYMANNKCYKTNTKELQNKLNKLMNLLETLKGCKTQIDKFDYYLDSDLSLEYNRTNDIKSPYNYTQTLNRVNEQKGSSNIIPKRANISDSIYLNYSFGSGTYKIGYDGIPLFVCQLGILTPVCAVKNFTAYKDYWNYAYNKVFVATYEYELNHNTYRWVKLPSGESISTEPVGDYKKYNRFIDIGHANYPVHYSTPGGEYEGLNIKITTIGYKNYLYNAYQSAIRNYNHSLTDNDLVSTEGQNQLLHDCYYEVKEGSPYCPSKGCKEDEYDLGSVRIVYRPISLTSPFPSIDGNGRNTGSNWCIINSDKTTDCKNTNENVQKYILNNRNTSGDSVYKKDPMYTITLNSASIKEIRKYNAQTNYDDFYLYCNGEKGKEGTECKSKFLRGDSLSIDNMPSNLDTLAERISSAIVSKDVSASCAMSDDWNNCDKLDNYER